MNPMNPTLAPTLIAPAATRPVRPARRVIWRYFSILLGFHLLLPIAFFDPFFTWWFPVYLLVGNAIFGSIGINLAYHRLLTHRSLEVPRWLEKTFVMCGICSLEGPPFKWVCTHRIHHQESDVEKDPHSPRENFLWGHMGWIYTEDPRMNSFMTYDKYIPDLLEESYLRWLHKRSRWAQLYLAHIVLLVLAAAGVGAIRLAPLGLPELQDRRPQHEFVVGGTPHERRRLAQQPPRRPPRRQPRPPLVGNRPHLLVRANAGTRRPREKSRARRRAQAPPPRNRTRRGGVNGLGWGALGERAL